MKSSPPSEAAKQIKLITASFEQVRILHHASKAPITAAILAERLGRRGCPANPSHILAGLVRSGLMLVKTNPANCSPQYSITPAGRRVLATAKKHLRQGSTQ